MKTLAPQARQDFDEDQPRDESGRWSSSGGGGGGGSEKKVSHATYRAAKETASKSSHAAMGRLVESSRHFSGARVQLESAAEKRGFTPRPYANGRGTEVHTDKWLNSTAVGGSHYHDTGKITLSESAANNLQEFAERWHKDPEWERGRHENLPNDLKSDDPVTRDGALRLANQILGAHILQHETMHGYGPLHSEDIEGHGLMVEEVTTEMATRASMRDDFGYDLHAAYKANKDVPAGYQPHIEAAKTAIMGTYGIPESAAQEVLEHAAIAFKQLPVPTRSYQKTRDRKEWISERMAGAMYSKDEAKIAELRKELDAVQEVAKPEDLFARTVDAVFAQGRDGDGHIDPKPSERANKLRDKLKLNWSRWVE